jgi:hypothetical protein
MAQAEAVVATDRPERYVKQLVSHLGHRLTTELKDDGTGVIHRGQSRCVLTPEPGALRMSATADTAEDLAAIQDVVARHLVRFATQDTLQIAWQPS